MSDSWICWNPRIEEPSNISPSVKTFSSKDSAGTVKCCTVPGRSQNLTSTNSTLLSPMNLSTSSAFVSMNPRFLSWRTTGQPLSPQLSTAGLRDHPSGGGSFPRQCYSALSRWLVYEPHGRGGWLLMDSTLNAASQSQISCGY